MQHILHNILFCPALNVVILVAIIRLTSKTLPTGGLEKGNAMPTLFVPSLRRTVLLTMLCGLIAAPMCAQEPDAIKGSGVVKSEDRTVHGFHAVKLSGTGSLTITQGARESLTVEAEDNILPLIVTEVKDGALSLHLARGHDFHATKPIRYTLTVTTLDDLGVSGASSAAMEALNTERLLLAASGASGVRLNKLMTHTLQVTSSGASRITVAGSTETQTATISSASRYQAENLKSREARIVSSGASNVAVNATVALTATASGASTIRYIGSPKVVSTVSGASSVRPKGNP